MAPLEGGGGWGGAFRRASRRGALPLALALLALVTGCQKTASERILGKWHGTKAEGVLPETQQAANEAAASMEFEFKKDVIIVRAAKDKDPMTARYVVLKEDRRSVIVVTELDGASEPQTLTLDTDDAMRWQVVQGKTITFERVKEDKAAAGGSAAPSASAP